MTQPQAYAVTEGDGLPVVFVHGMGVDHRSLMLLDEAFLCPESGAAATRLLKRIYLDLPGFGRTPALPARACGLPEMADWLQSAIDDLVGAGEPFALVGNSMGGALAREMVARESSRVRGLALIAPGGGSAAHSSSCRRACDHRAESDADTRAASGSDV